MKNKKISKVSQKNDPKYWTKISKSQQENIKGGWPYVKHSPAMPGWGL